MKSRVIALSAISAAFVALFLTLGAYIEFIDIISVIVASEFIVLPMYENSKLGSFLAFLAGGIIAFLFSGMNIFTLVFPSYFLFFGVLPIVNRIAESKNFNKPLWFAIKFVWFAAVCVFLVFFYIEIMKMPIEFSFDIFGKDFDFSGINNIEIIFWIAFAVVAAVFFLVYNKFVQVSQIYVDKVLSRIIKK